MHLRTLLTLSTMSLATVAFAADNNFDRTLSVSGKPNVSVATGSGYIHLNAGSDSQVHVVAHLHAGSGWWGGGSGDVQSRIDQIVANPPIQQSGNTITIGERHSGDRYRNISIDYEITLPRGSEINAATGSGDIESQGVGDGIRADSGSGSVRLRGVHGAAMLQTGSGDIELQEDGGQGEIRAQTGSGSIRLGNIDGPLHAQTGSGDIEASGKITGDSKIETGSGSVRLTLGSAGYTLDASTGSGTIHTQSPISMNGDLNRHHITGTVNGGGPTLRIVTGSGDIDIK